MIRQCRLLVATLALVGCVAAPGGLAAGELSKDRGEISSDVKQLSQEQRTLSGLEHAIDLWHDANLKSDEKLARQYMVQILVILEADLDYSRGVVSSSHEEKVASNHEANQPHQAPVARADDRRDAADDRQDSQRVLQSYQAKKRLYQSISRNTAFSNRYRLLGDYVDLIKREIAATGMELAEDVGELHEDHRH